MPRNRIKQHLAPIPCRVNDFLSDLAIRAIEAEDRVWVEAMVRRAVRRARVRHEAREILRLTAGDLAPEGGVFAVGRYARREVRNDAA